MIVLFARDARSISLCSLEACLILVWGVSDARATLSGALAMHLRASLARRLVDARGARSMIARVAFDGWVVVFAIVLLVCVGVGCVRLIFSVRLLR